MPRIDVPADRDPLVYLWTDGPALTATAGAFSDAVYRKSTLPIREFEAARIRIAQINDCTLCLEWRTARDVPDRAANLDEDGGRRARGALRERRLEPRLGRLQRA